MTPPLRFFLTEYDLDQIEALRSLVASQHATFRMAVEKLRREGGRDVVVDAVERTFDGVHGFLLAAFDARTAEVIDEATGYVREGETPEPFSPSP